MKLLRLFRRRETATGAIKTQTDNLPGLGIPCICAGGPKMQLSVSDGAASIFVCDVCGRLAWCSNVTEVRRYFTPEEDGTFCLVDAKEMYCQTCQSNQIHIRYLRQANTAPFVMKQPPVRLWACLKCRVRDGEQALKKEGE